MYPGLGGGQEKPFNMNMNLGFGEKMERLKQDLDNRKDTEKDQYYKSGNCCVDCKGKHKIKSYVAKCFSECLKEQIPELSNMKHECFLTHFPHTDGICF